MMVQLIKRAKEIRRLGRRALGDMVGEEFFEKRFAIIQEYIGGLATLRKKVHEVLGQIGMSYVKAAVSQIIHTWEK